MPLILRRSLNRPLTWDELDYNQVYLDINEWQLQSYEKGMWCYTKSADAISALYLCETTHNKSIYPSGHFAEVVGSTRIWRPFRGGGGTGCTCVFINESPSTATNLEGIPAGTTFPAPGMSMQDIWNMLLYPYQYPAFLSFGFLTHNVPLEIGDSFTTDTASWTTSNGANITPNSISISGDNLTTVTGLPANGTEPLTFNAPVVRTTMGAKTWTITGLNTKSQAFTRNYSLQWYWNIYWGTSANTILTGSQIKALANNALTDTFVGNYSFVTGDYKYLCIPDVLCSVTQFPANFWDYTLGLQVAMNNTYTYYDNTNSTYELVDVTNDFGITTPYRVYRTRWQVGSLIMIVT